MRCFPTLLVPVLVALVLSLSLRSDPLVAQEKPASPSIAAIRSLQTIAEKSNYQGTSNEQDVLNFLQILDDASSYASQTKIGTTLEGRPIQALIVAKEPKPNLPLPASDNRLVILLLGGIHSGECDGKESLLSIARDLLASDTPKYLDQAVLVFVPNFNADGNERVGVLHRPGQDGPSLGMGTRENGVGLDLNRDFIKLETPEVRSLVRAIDAWDVDVLIDAHTTNGSLHQYDLTYDVPHNPAANPAVVRWLRKEMLPAVTSELTSRGLPTFFYGNFTPDRKRWESFGHEPRYSTEYMGLRGKIGILVESYSYATYQRRIEASTLFIEACLKQLSDNAKQLNNLMHRNPTAAPKSLPIQAKVVADEATAIAKGYVWNKSTLDADKIGKKEQVDAPEIASGKPTTPNLYPSPRDRNRKTDMSPADFEVQLVNVGLSTLSVDAPECYFVSAENAWAAARLRMHGIQMAWIGYDPASKIGKQPATQYRINAVRELNEFQGHRLRKYEVALETVDWNPAPGWLISTRQRLGQLATYLLEPHSDDSLAFWNYFDPAMQPKSIYPVVRIERQIDSPTPLKPLGLSDAPSLDMSKEPLTLAKIYDPQRKIIPSPAPLSFPRWLPDGQQYLIQHEGRWMSVECGSGAQQPFDRPKRLVDALSKLDAF
ncbi:MAG: M14 family metallopeptidase, partial [Pirellula sp.]